MSHELTYHLRTWTILSYFGHQIRKAKNIYYFHAKNDIYITIKWRMID